MASMNNDLISREALKKAITLNRNIDRNAVCDVLDIIDNAPTVEPDISEIEEKFWHRCGFLQGYTTGLKDKERPQGEWINTQTLDYIGECSECCYISNKYYNFCPNCGADMRSENNGKK